MSREAVIPSPDSIAALAAELRDEAKHAMWGPKSNTGKAFIRAADALKALSADLAERTKAHEAAKRVNATMMDTLDAAEARATALEAERAAAWTDARAARSSRDVAKAVAATLRVDLTTLAAEYDRMTLAYREARDADAAEIARLRGALERLARIEVKGGRTQAISYILGIARQALQPPPAGEKEVNS